MYSKEAKQAWYQKNKERISKQKSEYYKANKEQFAERSKKWKEANPEKTKEISDKWYSANRETHLANSKKRGEEKKELITLQRRLRYQSQPEYKKKRLMARSEWGKKNRKSENLRQRRLNAKIKHEAINQYGGKCVICSELEIEFLVLDHIHNNGSQHRSEEGVRCAYRWAKKNNWPENIFQVLCHNHNAKKEKQLRPVGASQSAIWDQKTRLEALEKYGKSCACCNESDPDMLHLDHINGGGTSHCRTQKIHNLAKWAKRNNWPPIFRTLCANCNFSAYRGNGTCLHKRQTTMP